MNILNTTYNINKVRSNSFIAHTHQGLGDHIVCNGLINHFSEKFEQIYLPVKSRDINNITHLYRGASNIEIFKIENDTEEEDVQEFSKTNKLKILKVGFKKRLPPFNKSFYSQFNLPYSISFEKFDLQRDENKETELFNYLKDYYNIKKEFQLVHNQSSFGKVELRTNKNLPSIYIDKDTDIFKNIFYYLKVIELASEIHCLDSSFLHLVERVQTKANLYFHNIKKEGQKGAQVYLTKNWKEIKYLN